MSRTSRKLDYERKYNDLAALVGSRMFLLQCHPEYLDMVIKELEYGYRLEFDRYGHPTAALPPEQP